MFLIQFFKTRQKIIQQLVMYQGIVLSIAVLIGFVQGELSFNSLGFTLTILGMLLIVIAGLSVIGASGQTQNVLFDHASTAGIQGIGEQLHSSKRNMHEAYSFFRSTVTIGVLSIIFGVMLFFF